MNLPKGNYNFDTDTSVADFRKSHQIVRKTGKIRSDCFWLQISQRDELDRGG
jgi:hypothetical protein